MSGLTGWIAVVVAAVAIVGLTPRASAAAEPISFFRREFMPLLLRKTMPSPAKAPSQPKHIDRFAVDII
jgi:hypothetical protein